MVRIKDIAEKVGMASSTVSAVLGDRKYCMVLKPSMLIYFLESDDSGEIYTTRISTPTSKSARNATTRIPAP